MSAETFFNERREIYQSKLNVIPATYPTEVNITKTSNVRSFSIVAVASVMENEIAMESTAIARFR